MKIKLNFRNKGLFFIVLVCIAVILISNYAYSKKIEIDDQVIQAEELAASADILQKAQLSAYNAVSELIVIFQAKSRDEAIDITHGRFLDLLTNYEKITELYPDKRDGFKSFLRSLADSINQPTQANLQALAKELSSFQSELDLIMDEVVRDREVYVTQYTDGLRNLLTDLLSIITATVILLALIVSIFFRRLTGDIKTLNFSLGRVLHSSYQPLEIKLNRTDEVQQLSERIAELSERLKKREQALSLEQRKRAHLEQNKALEHLTQGLVHAIGNPIMGLIGLIKYLETNPVQQSELKENLATMADSAQKIMNINEDLKLFSVRTGRERELLDLNFVLSEHIKLMTYDDDWFGIEVKFLTVENLPVFTCSKDDVGIVIENLLENAREALRRTEKHSLLLSIETIMQGSDNIGFVVSDNADGMSAEVQQHAMDAFYSTKKGASQGDGMGLLSCLSIVEKYGGKITINSKPSHGTSVTVLFPVYEESEIMEIFSEKSESQNRESGDI